MAVADSLDEAVEDGDRIGVAACIAQRRAGAGEECVEVELALGQQPIEIGIFGVDRGARLREVVEPGLRGPGGRLGRARTGAQNEHRHRRDGGHPLAHAAAIPLCGRATIRRGPRRGKAGGGWARGSGPVPRQSQNEAERPGRGVGRGRCAKAWTAMARGRRDGIVIAGGGLAGALAALAMARHRPDVPLMIVEEGETFGGEGVRSFTDAELGQDGAALIGPLAIERWPGFYVAFPGFSRNLGDRLCAASARSTCTAPSSRRSIPNTIGSAPRSSRCARTRWSSTAARRSRRRARSTPAAPPACRRSTSLYEARLEREYRFKAPHRVDRPVLIDATVAQSEALRFVQCLPLAEDRLIVADVMISDRAQPDAEAGARLDAYVAARGWRPKGRRRRAGLGPAAAGRRRFRGLLAAERRAGRQIGPARRLRPSGHRAHPGRRRRQRHAARPPARFLGGGAARSVRGRGQAGLEEARAAARGRRGARRRAGPEQGAPCSPGSTASRRPRSPASTPTGSASSTGCASSARSRRAERAAPPAPKSSSSRIQSGSCDSVTSILAEEDAMRIVGMLSMTALILTGLPPTPIAPVSASAQAREGRIARPPRHDDPDARCAPFLQGGGDYDDVRGYGRRRYWAAAPRCARRRRRRRRQWPMPRPRRRRRRKRARMRTAASPSPDSASGGRIPARRRRSSASAALPAGRSTAVARKSRTLCGRGGRGGAGGRRRRRSRPSRSTSTPAPIPTSAGC